MRTTIKRDDQLLPEAKRVAAETGKSLTTVIEAALRDALAQGRQAGQRRRVRLPTLGEGGLLPGVGLDDTSALLDLMPALSRGPRP